MPITTKVLRSNREDRVARFIRDYWENFGFPPSYREIGQATGIPSTATVQSVLVTLEYEGRIVQDPHKKTVRPANNGDPAWCSHDWRVEQFITNGLVIFCLDCKRKTEVDYDPDTTDPQQWLKYTGEI